MKKRLLSIILAAVVLTASLPIMSVSAADEDFQISECPTVTFGEYPQSKVTDEATIAALDGIEKEWVSYGYYSGTNTLDDGNMTNSDYMKFADVQIGSNKYRCVYFDQYRPWQTGLQSSNEASYSYQDDNGYFINNIYYFKYEPLQWRLLDPENGLLMCNSVIDSQAYNNFLLHSDEGWWGDIEKTFFSSDWANCSLRNWLNNDFYNSAFSTGQKSKIMTVSNDNKSKDSAIYDGASTDDKVYLLSFWDAINSSYGFSSEQEKSDSARMIKSSDYAKCQGCYISKQSNYAGNTMWWVRSPFYSYNAGIVYSDGKANANNYVNFISYGVVPAISVADICSVCNHNYTCSDTSEATHSYMCSICGDIKTESHSFDISGKCDCGFAKKVFENGDIIKVGSYPQSKVTDEDLIAELNRKR